MDEIFLEENPKLLDTDVVPNEDAPEEVDANILGTVPYSKWGNPWSSGYFNEYVVRVSFMGKSMLWHKWAVVPFMNVQKKLVAEGFDTSYHWEVMYTYSKRYIAGTHQTSNHAFPVAIDINPKQNPMRYDNKLITDLPPRIVQIFKEEGFKWGGTYIHVKDTMHFEYLGEPVKNYDYRRTLSLKEPMMKGKDVTEAQDLMKYYGYNIAVDGTFGKQTDAMARSFQASKMLTSDGIIGTVTWTELLAKRPDRVLKKGLDGKDVLWVQKVLYKIGVTVGWTEDDLDGKFGSKTLVAVEAFQTQNGLEVDGIVGANTWKMLRYKSN